MHKKITTIEEYIDTNIKAGNIFSTVSYENTDLGIEFRLTSRTHYARYANNMREYILSKMHNNPDWSIIRTNQDLIVDSFLMPIRQWWLLESATRYVEAEKVLARSIMDSIDVAISNVPNADSATTKVMDDINSFAAAVNNLNQFVWPTQGVADIWTSYYNTLHRQINARKSGEWELDQTLAKSAFNILVSGQFTGVASYADVFSLGTIQTQTWRFN